MTADRIPESWEMMKFEDVINSSLYGCNPTTGKDIEGVPYLRITDIDDEKGGLKYSKLPEKAKFSKEENEAKYGLSRGDIVIARSGASSGQSYVYDPDDGKMVYASYLIRFSIDTSLVSLDYIGAYLKSPIYWNQVEQKAKGAAQDNINAESIKDFEIPVPPLEDQEKVVKSIEKRLKNIKDLDSYTSELYHLLEEYEDSLLAFILSGKKDMSEGAVGGIPTEDVVPDDWRLEDFGDVVDVNPRISKPDTDTFAHVPMDGVSDETQSIDYFSERDSVYSGLAKFEEGDILFARITPCMENGKVAIVDELPEGRNMSFGSTEFAVFRTNEDVSTEYVFNYVKSQFIREVAEDRMKGATGRERVPLDFFKKDLKIPIPPEGQEDEVLEKLRNIRENVNKANHSIKMVDELFDEYRDSVLAHAFKGELVDIEAEDRDSEDLNEGESGGSRPEFDGDGQQSLEQIAGGNK